MKILDESKNPICFDFWQGYRNFVPILHYIFMCSEFLKSLDEKLWVSLWNIEANMKNLNNKSKVFNIFNVEPLKFCLIWVEFKCWQVIENAAWADVEYRTFCLLKFLKSCLLTKLQINQNVFLYVNIWIIFKNVT